MTYDVVRRNTETIICDLFTSRKDSHFDGCFFVHLRERLSLLSALFAVNGLKMSPVGFCSNIVSERNCFVVKSSYSVLRGICSVVKSSYSVIRGICSVVKSSYSVLRGFFSVVKSSYSDLRGIRVVVKSSYSVIGYEIRNINDSIVFFLVVFHTVSIILDKLEIQYILREVEKTFVGVKQV